MLFMRQWGGYGLDKNGWTCSCNMSTASQGTAKAKKKTFFHIIHLNPLPVNHLVCRCRDISGFSRCTSVCLWSISRLHMGFHHKMAQWLLWLCTGRSWAGYLRLFHDHMSDSSLNWTFIIAIVLLRLPKSQATITPWKTYVCIWILDSLYGLFYT